MSLYSCFTITNARVDLPVPAGPANNRCGILKEFVIDSTLFIISSCPTISKNLEGLYFSVHISLTIVRHCKEPKFLNNQPPFNLGNKLPFFNIFYKIHDKTSLI